MGVGPLAVEIVLTFCLSAVLLYKYGNWKRHHIFVTVPVLVAWYFSFTIIVMLPMDVSSTTYRQCLRENSAPKLPSTTLPPSLPTPIWENASVGNDTNLHLSEGRTQWTNTQEVVCVEPWSYIPNNVLRNLWRVVYWTSQCLTWIVLPLMQSYSQAGDFTVMGKLRSAIIDNAIYYGSYLIIFIVLLFYIAASPDLHLDGPRLKIICITTSNTWGLFLLVLLLGYGLVEVPRSCWNSAKRGFMLTYTYFKAAKLHVEKCEAEDALEDILEDIKKISDCVASSHPLRKNVETILAKVPQDLWYTVNNYASRDPGSEQLVAFPTEKSLVRLHRQFKRTLRIHHRARTQWNLLVESGIALEDVARNETSSERFYRHSFQPSRPAWMRHFYTPVLEWYWKCLIRGWILRILTVFFTVLTVFVVWSEVTFFNKTPVLSLFAVFVDLAKQNYDYFYIEVVSCLTLAYLCICAYYTIFKIRILNYYYLAPHHQTDEYSLIFSGMLLCRLTPSLCLNFLGLVHLDSHITSDPNVVETSYTQIMGHMDVISFISNGFNIYFPIGILVLCLATYFHLGSHFLHVIGFQQFIGDDDMTNDLVDEGRELVKREKRKRQREEGGESRRRQIHEMASSIIGGGRATTTRSWTERDSDGLRPKREEAGEMTARAELLRDVEPVDYTGGDGDHQGGGGGRDSFVRLYQGERNSSSAWSRTWNGPPRGIFDDI